MYSNMSSTLKININPVTSIDDEGVIKQLPKNIRKDLGAAEGSGFNLLTSKRDLAFRYGLVQYMVGERTVDVIMD